MKKPTISRKMGGFQKQILIFCNFSIFFFTILPKLKPTIQDLLIWKVAYSMKVSSASPMNSYYHRIFSQVFSTASYKIYIFQPLRQSYNSKTKLDQISDTKFLNTHTFFTSKLFYQLSSSYYVALDRLQDENENQNLTDKTNFPTCSKPSSGEYRLIISIMI